MVAVTLSGVEGLSVSNTLHMKWLNYGGGYSFTNSHVFQIIVRL